MDGFGLRGGWLSCGGTGKGNVCLTGWARGGWTLAIPHSVIKAPSCKLPEWDEGP